MPMFQYFCKNCKCCFDELVYGDEKVTCPKCKSGDVVRGISCFSTSGTDSSHGGGGCSTCGGGDCSCCH